MIGTRLLLDPHEPRCVDQSHRTAHTRSRCPRVQVTHRRRVRPKSNAVPPPEAVTSWISTINVLRPLPSNVSASRHRTASARTRSPPASRSQTRHPRHQPEQRAPRVHLRADRIVRTRSDPPCRGSAGAPRAGSARASAPGSSPRLRPRSAPRTTCRCRRSRDARRSAAVRRVMRLRDRVGDVRALGRGQ